MKKEFVSNKKKNLISINKTCIATTNNSIQIRSDLFFHWLLIRAVQTAPLFVFQIASEGHIITALLIQPPYLVSRLFLAGATRK